MGWSLATRGSWAALADNYGALTTIFVVGFALQVLLGALSYLLPVVIGGGPSVLRAGMAELERWGTARVAVANLGLAICLLPVPSLVRVVLSMVTLVALALSIPLMLRGLRASIRAKKAKEEAAAGGPTGLSSGVCRAYYTNPFLAEAARDSIAMMADFDEIGQGHDSGFRRTGLLYLHPPQEADDRGQPDAERHGADLAVVGGDNLHLALAPERDRLLPVHDAERLVRRVQEQRLFHDRNWAILTGFSAACQDLPGRNTNVVMELGTHAGPCTCRRRRPITGR